MVRMVMFVVLALIIVGCSTCGGREMSYEDMTEDMLYTIVRIDNSEGGMGSGVVIDGLGKYNFILTAKHVVAHEGSYSVTFFPDGKSYPAEVIKVSEEHDLAIVQVRHNHKYKAKWGKPFQVMPFEKIFKIGYSLGHEHPRITDGIVSDVDDYTFTISGGVVWGDSGGGVFVLEDGEYILAGITSALGIATPFGFPYPVYHVGHIVDMYAAEELFHAK